MADARDGVDNDHTTLIITFAFKRLQKKPVADWLIDFICELILRYYSQNRDGAQSKADRPGKPSSSQEKKKRRPHYTDKTICLLTDEKVLRVKCVSDES